MNESSEWVSWVGPARKGDLDAIDKLSQYFSPFVHAVLLSRVSHQTASMFVRPVLTQSIFRLAGLANDAGFAQWILTAAREKAFDAAKTPGSTVDVAGQDPLINNGHLVLTKIRTLAEAARERLVMRLLEGISGFEIAQIVGGKEADVRADLEKSASALVQKLTGDTLSFAGDSYLWSRVGTPHAALIPLENQLTSLRYDPTLDPEMTPAHTPALVAPKNTAPEGRRQTGAQLEPLKGAEITDPTGEVLPLPHDDEENTAANPLPPAELMTMKVSAQKPSGKQLAPEPVNPFVNPFGTAVKTIHVSDLPAAADFADLQGTNAAPPEPWGPTPKEDLNASTMVITVPVESKPKLGDSEQQTQMRPSGARARKSLPPPDDDGMTAIRSMFPSTGRGSVTGNPDPMKTVMGLPAVTVRRGSVARSWRPFAIALLFALIAVGVSLLLFDGTNRRIKSGWNLVPVVVAGTDLTVGTVITVEMISTRMVPEAFVTSSAIKPDSTSYVVNQKILVDAQAGDPLLWSQFEVARSNERLSKKVMHRARAFDLMTNQSIAVGGWVQPSDRIDIIASLKANEKGQRVAITLLQDVPVLSTGKITSSAPSSARKDGDKDYIDLSVLLLPEEAELIALATEVGDLQFTLRTEDDHETLADHRGSNSKTLLQGERVRLLQQKRMKTIQQIRNARPP